jgi:adenine-specific DNA-methyltransferase
MTKDTVLQNRPLDEVVLRELSPVECRVEEMRETFPDAFREGMFDPERLLALLRGEREAATQPRRFGLEWPGKTDALHLLRMAGHGSLLPSRDDSINFDTASHVAITGDNLEVMKLLQKAYFGAFRMIYMDPPYNTGSDLIYNDDYKDPLSSYLHYSGQLTDDSLRVSSLLETDGRFHSRWLTMMLPRLFVARNLLAENGVIFVSIDDHESHHLRILMDEVFGGENFVCAFVWEKRYAPPPDTKDVGYVHENVLCYRRSDAFQAALLPMTEQQKGRYKNADKDPRGPWKPADYTCRYTAKERPTLYYPIRNPNTGKDTLPKKTRVWACCKEEHLKNETEKRIWWPPDAQVPAKKKFLSEIRQGAMPMTLLRHEDVGHTDEATKELRKWFPDVKVTPKPTRLIRHLLRIAAVQKGDLVLDCFAGTGTTAEAVLDANEQDDVGARFVLIQLPEPLKEDPKRTMADLARERAVRRAKNLPKAKAAGVRCFALSASSFRAPSGELPKGKDGLAEQLRMLVENVKDGRTDEDLLFEVLLKAGFKLTDSVERIKVAGQVVFSVAEGMLLICLERKVTRDCLRALIERTPERVVCLDVAFDGNDQLKTNLLLEMRSHGIEFRTI